MARPPEIYIRSAVKDIWNEIHLNFACINNADRVGSEVPHISDTKSYFLQRREVLSEMKVQLQPYETRRPD